MIHQKIQKPFQAMYEEWQKAGLLHLIKTFDGAYVPRFVRGNPNALSKHAYGLAIDFNAGWNALNTIPALKGREGSVRELVPIANQHGFFWGGHFNSRLDGMHFEFAKF
jgi:hypothetical protein